MFSPRTTSWLKGKFESRHSLFNVASGQIEETKIIEKDAEQHFCSAGRDCRGSRKTFPSALCNNFTYSGKTWDEQRRSVSALFAR